MKWGAAVRDILVLVALNALAGLLIGHFHVGIPTEQRALGLANVLIFITGFAISGALAREGRWRHVLVVALGLWLTGVVNAVRLPSAFVPWLLSWIPMTICMGLGVGLSYLFVRPTRGAQARVSEREAPHAPVTPEQT